MTSNDIANRVAKIARQAMTIARSQVNIARGNTLRIVVPLSGIELPADIAGLVRSVAESTGLSAEYHAEGLVLSWTNNGNVGPAQSSTDALSDINNVLKEMLDLQIEAAQKSNSWSRSDVLAALSFLLALIVAILGHANIDIQVHIDTPSIGAPGHTAAQPHPMPGPSPGAGR
jgi:hypothetical protein